MRHTAYLVGIRAALTVTAGMTRRAATHTGWKGYSTANAIGQLIAAKVHAFLCTIATCTNLLPPATYYFANAANSGAGGASFITDNNGNGPQDSADWSASNYFSGTCSYWTNMGTTSSNLWSSAPGSGSNAFGTCQDWTVTSGNGFNGASANTDSNRWITGNDPACTNTMNLICFVNP